MASAAASSVVWRGAALRSPVGASSAAASARFRDRRPLQRSVRVPVVAGRSDDWKTRGCELERGETSEGLFQCNCSLVGSADVQVVVREYLAPSFAVVFNTISFDDLSYFGALGTNWIPWPPSARWMRSS